MVENTQKQTLHFDQLKYDHKDVHYHNMKIYESLGSILEYTHMKHFENS